MKAEKFLEGTKQDNITLAPIRTPGRPKGAKNKSTLFKEIIAKNVEETAAKEFAAVVDKTFEMAKEGDTTCIKLLWDKFYSSLKAIDGDSAGTPVVNITISGINPEKMAIDGESNGDE